MIRGIKLSQLAIVVIVISLFASVTNFIPLSLTFIILLLFIPYLLDVFPGNSVISALIILYCYFFVSTLIYSPEAFINPSFYRRDGNFFVTFLPLLLLPGIKKKFHTEKIVRTFIYFSTIVSLLCMILPRLEDNPNIQHLVVLETGGKVNHFLFAAHNAAGGFISIVLALNIGLLFTQNMRLKPALAICALINFAALYDTNSRGSLIGFLLALLILFFSINPVIVRKKHKRPDMAIFLVILLISLLIISYLSNEETLDHMLNDLDISRSNTIIDRLINLWPRALDVFKQSPIFGIGYGAFNDQPYHITPLISGLIAINNPDQLVYSPAHAHNTYLHVMAETGIVGLILLVFMIGKMRDEIIEIRNKPLRVGLFLALQVSLYSSLTEHYLFSPAQMIPFLLVLGMTLSEKRQYENKQCLVVPVSGKIRTIT